jgi:hypothetical protein
VPLLRHAVHELPRLLVAGGQVGQLEPGPARLLLGEAEQVRAGRRRRAPRPASPGARPAPAPAAVAAHPSPARGWRRAGRRRRRGAPWRRAAARPAGRRRRRPGTRPSPAGRGARGWAAPGRRAGGPAAARPRTIPPGRRGGDHRPRVGGGEALGRRDRTPRAQAARSPVPCSGLHPQAGPERPQQLAGPRRLASRQEEIEQPAAPRLQPAPRLEPAPSRQMPSPPPSAYATKGTGRPSGRGTVKARWSRGAAGRARGTGCGPDRQPDGPRRVLEKN